MSAETTNISHIQDEDVLRKMWQDTEDFGKKKEIRSHMYKLREQRLREFYNGSEITESRSSKTTGKVTQSSTHADSLVDQSFQSFKSKEVRDSGSPTRDIHYKVPDSNEWQIASNKEISKDGKTRIHSTVASVQGTQKIDGGQIDFQGKNENTSSIYHNADENSVTTRSQSSSHSSTASRMVASNTVPSEQIELPSNLQGATKVIRETKTLPDGSTVTTTRYDTTSGSTHTSNQSAHVRTSQASSSSRQVNEKTSENIVYVDNKEVAVPSNLQGITKVTRETKTLPDGSTVISTRYNTTSDNIQTGHIKTAQTSSTSHITGEQQATLNISTQNNDNISTKTVRESKIIPETYTKTSVTNQVTDIKGSVQNPPQIPDNLQGVTKITKETKTLPDGSIMTTTKYHTVSGTTTHTEVTGSGKISKEHSSVTNKSTKRFEESTDNQQNYKTEKTHSVNNKVIDNKDVIRTNVTSTQENNRKNFVEDSTKVVNVNENINITRISTDDRDISHRKKLKTDNFINTERKQEVLTRDKYPQESPKSTPSTHRDISPTKPTKTDYQPSKPTDGQYETTYRTDYTNRKISVEVSPTHDAFARSLRAVSPDRVPSRGSHKTSNSSIPEKMRHPSRISPERTHRNRGGSPTKSNDRFSSTDTYIYNKRRTTDEEPKTKSPSPKRYGSTDTFRKTESQETITISKTSRHDVTNTTTKKKDIKRTSQHSLPRSRSPSPTKPSDRKREMYEIVTDLDEDVTITTEKQKTGSRPNTLELSKKSKKITDRSPSSPLSDLGSPKKSPTKDLRRTSSFKSPTKDHSPTKYPTESYKAPKDNLSKSPTRNLPEDRPLKRTDTYEERCRQILGITEVTDKRKSSLERSPSKRSSFRRNTSTNSVDTTGSTSPTKEKPRSPTKSPVKERPRSKDYETTDIVSTRKITDTTDITTRIDEKPRSPSKSPVRERPLSREYETIDTVSTTKTVNTHKITRPTDDKPRSPMKERPRSRDYDTTDIVTKTKTVDTNKITRPTDDKPRSPTKERPRSRDYETTNIVTTTKTLDTNKISSPTGGKPRPKSSPVKERPRSKDFETTYTDSVNTIVDTTEITRPIEGKPRSPLRDRPLSTDYEITDIVTTTKIEDTNREQKPRPTKSPVKDRPHSKDDIVSTTTIVDTAEITRPTEGKPRSPVKERPISRDYETTDITTTTNIVDTTEITKATGGEPRNPVREKPCYEPTDIGTTTKTVDTTEIIHTQGTYSPIKSPVKDITEIAESIRPTKGKPKSPVKEKPFSRNNETLDIVSTTETETTVITSNTDIPEKGPQSPTKGEKAEPIRKTPHEKSPNKYHDKEHTTNVQKITEQVDVYNKEQIIITDDEYKTPHQQPTKPNQKKHPQTTVDQIDQTIFSKTSQENISRKDIKNVTDDITQQEVEIVTMRPINETVDDSPKKSGRSITEFPSQRKPQKHTPKNVTQSKTNYTREEDDEVITEETTIYDNNRPSNKGPYMKERPKTTTDKHKTTTTEFIMQEKLSTEINSSTEVLIDETDRQIPAKKTPKVKETRPQSTPSGKQEIITTETKTKPGEKKEPTKKTPITEFPSQIRKEPKTTTKTSTSITEDISVEEVTKKSTKPSPEDKKPTKQGPDTQEIPLKPTLSNNKTVKTTEKENNIKTSKDKVTDEEETIIDEFIVVDDSDVPKVTIGRPIPKDEKPKKLPKQHAVHKTTENEEDDVDYIQEVIVTDEFEIVNIPKQKPKQEIPQQTRKHITKNISKENITPTKEKPSKVKKPTNKEPVATEKFFEPIDYANMVPVEEPLMIKKHIDTSCPDEIRHAEKITKKFIEKEQKEINENINIQRRPVKPEKETPVHKTQITTTAKKPQKQPEKKFDKPSTRKPINGITEYQDQYSTNLKPKSIPTKPKTTEPTTVFKPSNKINSIPTRPATKVQPNVETITTKKTTKTINLRENEPSEPTKLRKPLPSKGPVKPLTKPAHPDHTTKKHLVTTTITLKSNTQPVTTKPKVSKTTTTVTKTQKNRVIDLKQKRVNEYVSTDTDEEETIVETVDVTRRNGTKRQPEKCIITKTVIINNNTQPRQIVVDLQRSKSSREPTPDKICPVPTEYGGYGSPRYPDEIEEPDDVNVRKPPKRLSDIPLLESEDVTNFSRITEISDTKVVTDIDKVETTDESLLSVNRKINLFLDTADKLTKGGKSPSGPAPKVERPKLEVTQDLESDECLLSVSEKVNKFINTADQFMNVRDLPERPKSPRCKFNNDKISSNNFITTEQKTIQKENVTTETRKVSLENLNTVDNYRKSSPTDIKKEPKSVHRAEKPVEKKTNKSPVRESQKTRPELVDQNYPNYSTITKRVSLENLEIQTSIKNTEDIRRKSPERVSPTRAKRPSDRGIPPDDTRNKPSERLSPDRLSPTKTTPSHPGTPNRRPPNEYTSIKSIKTQEIKSTTKEVSTTPKSSKSKPVEDKKNILSTTGRLRSTESIKKARALFENINKEAERVNNKSPISTKKETVVRKLSYSSDDDLQQSRTTKSRSNSPDKPTGDVPHYMLPLDRPTKPKSESPERKTLRSRSPDGSESGGIPHYMLPLERPKTHTSRSKSPDRESLRSCSPNVKHKTGEVPHYMLPLDRSHMTSEPDRDIPRHKSPVMKTEHGDVPHYMSPLHKPNNHVPRPKSPDRESLRSCSSNVRHETGEVPHYMLPLDRSHTTDEPDRDIPRHKSPVTKLAPGDTPHYMSPLHKPQTHTPRSKSPGRESFRSISPKDREVPRHKQHLTRTEPGVTPHYMLPLENPKTHIPRSKSPDRESLRSSSPNVRHETGEVPHYMLPLDRSHTPNEADRDFDIPRHKQYVTNSTPHYMSPLHRPKTHTPRSNSPDRESLRSCSPNIRNETGEIPHYRLPLDKKHTHSTPRPKSPERDTPRHKSPESGDIPHYMLPLDRDVRTSRSRSKSPGGDSPRHTSPDVRSEASDVPHYMLPLERNVHHKDKLITGSKPDSPNKFGVTLKKVHPDKPVTKTTSTKVSTERKTSNVENITEEEIEDIFEIEVLEELLQRITSYEIRRVIRIQIKLIKKLITENRLTIYIQERKQSKIRKDRSETITQKVEYHSSYNEKRKSSTDRTIETRTRSPQRTPSPTRQPKNQFYRPDEQISSREVKRQSPQRTSSPTKPFNENNLIKTTTTTTNTTIRTSTPREIVRKPGERYSPERQSPQRQPSPTRTQTTVQTNYRLKSSCDVPTTKQISRKTEELRKFSPERVSLVETTSSTEKKEPSQSSPDKKTPKSGYSILKKTEVQQKKVEEKKPEWITNRNLKKVTGSSTNEQVRTTSKKTVKEEKIVKSSEYEPTDLITSSYGVGPTDENGTPLFGLKALRQTNNGTTKVQGTFITSEYYSENGQEPVGQISVTNYSTDPRDLSTEEQIQNNNLVTSVTTTQKFGYEDSPSLETLTNKRTLEQSTEYEERRIIRNRLRSVMAEQEACADLVQKASQEQPGGKIEGESLLLPLLQGLLEKKEPTTDSGTESGEDQRNGLIAEVQNALDKLSQSLCSDSTDITPERRSSLLYLVTKLQAGLSTAVPKLERRLSSEPGRFNKRKNRQNRHTVGVSSEELADARRLMEEIAGHNKIPSTTPKDSLNIQKQNSESSVLSNPPNITFVSKTEPEQELSRLSKQNSDSSVTSNPSINKYISKGSVKNTTPKPFSSATNSISNNSSTAQTPDFSDHLDGFFGEESSETQKPTLKENYSDYSTPTTKLTASALDKIKMKEVRGSQEEAKMLQYNPIYTKPDNVNYNQPLESSREQKLRFNSDIKKQKMKRANTIDIPKPLQFYEESDDSDGETEAQQHKNNYYALRGPIRVGNPVNKKTVPAFEPKTVSDQKFLAFLNKNNQIPEEQPTRTAAWTNQKNRTAVWENKFGNIKSNFENVSKVPSSTVKNFWKTQDDAIMSRTNQIGPKISRQSARNLQQMFEDKRRESQERVVAPPQIQRVSREIIPSRDDQNAITGKLSVKTEPEKNYRLIPAPLPVNKFSHAPQSAFKPINRRHNSFEQKPTIQEPANEEVSDILKTKIKENNNSSLFLYSPKPLHDSEGNSPALSPISNKPWLANDNKSRVLSIAAKRFENSSQQNDIALIKPRKLSKEFTSAFVTPQAQNEKTGSTYLTRGDTRKSSVRKLSDQYDNLGTKTPEYTSVTSVTYQPSGILKNHDSFLVKQQNNDYSRPKFPPNSPKELKTSPWQHNPQEKNTIQSYKEAEKPKHIVNPVSIPNAHQNYQHTNQNYQQKENNTQYKPQAIYQHVPGKDTSSTSPQNENVYTSTLTLNPAPKQGLQQTEPLMSPPKLQTQLSNESVHEYTAINSKVMGGPVSQQAVTVRQKSPMTRNEHDISAAFSLKNTLSTISKGEERLTKTSPVNLSKPTSPQRKSFTSPEPPRTEETKEQKNIPNKLSSNSFTSKVSEPKTILNTVPSQVENKAFGVVRPIQQQQKQPTIGPVYNNVSRIQRATAQNQQFVEFNEKGQGVVTSKFHIPIVNVEPTSPGINSPILSPLHGRALTKSDSWHQICMANQSPPKSASPRSNVVKSKSSHSLAVPQRQYEAGISKEELLSKKRAMEVYLMGGNKSPQQVTPTKSEKVVKSSINRIKTSEKQSAFKSTVTKISTQQQVTKKPLSPFAKFQQLDKQNSINTPTPPGTPGTPKTPGNGPLFKFTDPALSLSAATIKDRLLYWCRMKTKEYENVQLDNFSTSWADGLAFCALIHHFLPDAFDYHALTPKERRHNFELAFKVASDKADIFPLLDVDDMMATRRPDWKCVFTYVQSIYRRFKDEEI
ncbi:unnamed protein product [Diabrotica balteata]|uniref:Calponin-homology (CH) domain-containing protein n=1 Tax=Diabrotica balteata TaxID=107213 RepID=A0A9N9T0D3_DIABA|nr:unnamed protein product [Diabrotica balteata]